MGIIEFSRYLGNLKGVERSGWVKTRIPNPESVADHSFRVAAMAMVLAPEYGADQLKSMKMALTHDVGESIIGDIVTVRGAKTDKALLGSKLKAERDAMARIMSFKGGEEYLALFDEFNANRTAEARLVRQLDKLEMAMQACEYERAHDVDLQEFFLTARGAVKDRRLLGILGDVESRRPRRTAARRK